jgi:ubiquinone/menaquinone biosynthesis C-methylase UbiE
MKNKKGILDLSYIGERESKLHVSFRYKVRAHIAAIKVTKYLKPPIRLIDFGCAEGRTLLEIRNLLGTGEYLGLEHSQSLLDCAPTLPSDVRLKEENITSLPDTVQENYYDVATALAVLEHLENPSIAVKEAYRILKNGGLFIATCPDPIWDDISSKLGLLKDTHHNTKMDKVNMFHILRSSGFKVIEYHKFMFAPIGFMPYINIPINVRFSLTVDRAISKLRLVNFLFVNQCIVGLKP